MAHTDRDQKRYTYKHHNEVCTKWVATGRWVARAGSCECDTWWDWSMRYMPVPAWWRRDQRQAERSKLRQQVQRARAGHVDWDDLPTGEGRPYRRPYYW